MTDIWIPGNKAELMTAIEHEWKLLVQLAESLTDEQMTAPDEGVWSPKDNLAHLTEWMNILMGYHMDRKPAHEVIGAGEEVVQSWDMEVINPVLFSRNKERSRKEVFDGVKSMYERMVAKLEATPFEDLLKPRHADDPQKRPLLAWVLGNTTKHFQEHRENRKRNQDQLMIATFASLNAL